MQMAPCRWFPDIEWVPRRAATPAPDAVAICQTCPVRVECQRHGTEVDALGIWGGLTQLERRAARQR